VVFDVSLQAVKELSDEGAVGASSLADFTSRLATPRACG
jgi:6-phosphogluconate dehydrogenase (decarboxylating)